MNSLIKASIFVFICVICDAGYGKLSIHRLSKYDHSKNLKYGQTESNMQKPLGYGQTESNIQKPLGYGQVESNMQKPLGYGQA